MMMKRFVGTAAVLSAWGAAQGQVIYSSDFEAPLYTGSAAGTLLTNGFGGGGQDGWYNPLAGSNDSKVYTYAGNTYAIAAHPSGGTMFQVGDLTPAGGFGRAEHLVAFTGGKWKATWDCTGLWAGATLPAVDNLGSFSMQPSATARYFQQLMSWGITAVGPLPNATNHSTTGAMFHIAYGIFKAALPNTIVFETPGPAWRDLPVNNWYRCTVTWDFDARQVTECTIQNLTTASGVTTVDTTPFGWYLFGGPASTNALPTAFRLFAGGGAGTGPAGNVTAFDNIKFEKIVVCYPDCNGDLILNLADFGCFQTAFAGGNMYADCNGDLILNLADFGCFQTAFAAGCP